MKQQVKLPGKSHSEDKTAGEMGLQRAAGGKGPRGSCLVREERVPTFSVFSAHE